MRYVPVLLAVLFLFTLASNAQTNPRPKPKPTPAVKPVAPKPAIDKGSASGGTYTNNTFGFEVTFPEPWVIAGDDFDAVAKAKGFDLSLKAPSSLPLTSKTLLDRSIRNVQVLLECYRATAGATDNAFVRVSVEDLTANPQIKDAVDYFDAVRAMYKSMKLPIDFSYGETQAEKLGKKQFGYLDTLSKAGKKRMYATVRDRNAILITISYTNDSDLQTLRNVLSEGDFALK